MGALEDYYRRNIYCPLPSFSLGFVYPDDSRVNDSCFIYYVYVLIVKVRSVYD